VLRKLIYSRKEDIEPAIFSFIGQSLGKKYVLTPFKLLKRKSLPKKKKHP
jgi:hypothetical protein